MSKHINSSDDPLQSLPTKSSAPASARAGAVLRAAREKTGKALDAVAAETRIPRRYLQALEEDHFDAFPAFVYMRGFLKSYCDYLDVPFDEVWKSFSPNADAEPAAGSSDAAAAAPAPARAPTAPSHAPTAPSHDNPVPARHGPAARVTVSDDEPAPAPVSLPVHHEPAHHSPTQSQSSALIAIVLGGSVALALCVRVFSGRPAAHENAIPNDLGRSRVVEAASAPAETPPALAPLATAVKPKASLHAVEDAWVSAFVDGARVYEGRLPKGATLEWVSAKSVSFKTTSPASLELRIDGERRAIEAPGADGAYDYQIP